MIWSEGAYIKPRKNSVMAHSCPKNLTLYFGLLPDMTESKDHKKASDDVHR